MIATLLFAGFSLYGVYLTGLFLSAVLPAHFAAAYALDI